MVEKPVEDKPLPLYTKLLGLAVIIAVVAVLIIWHNRLSADFWPLDASRVAPNLVASVIVSAFLFIIGVLIWPPTRRRIHQFTDKKLGALHELGHKERKQVQARLDHIIKHHPDIPDFPESDDDHLS